MSYTVLGISSGGGVSLFPFKDHLIGNIEPRAIFHTPKSIQWKQNFKGIPLWRHFPEAKKDLKGKKIDWIISSPDCGSGSILRYSRAKQLGDIKGNVSLDYFFAGIKHFNPKGFYFENLPNISKSFPDKEFDEILNGYNIIRHISSVARWGNSQIFRKRLIVIGIRKDIPLEDVKKYFKLPDYTDQNKTCSRLYEDLDSTPNNVELGHVRERLDEIITMYSGNKMEIRAVRDMWKHVQGRRWPADGRKFTCAPGVYRNRKNDYPCTARKANRQFDHKGLMLTPRQLARIQGVPDEFKIYIDPNKLNFWINKGRALITKSPPAEISVWLKRKLDKILNHEY